MAVVMLQIIVGQAIGQGVLTTENHDVLAHSQASVSTQQAENRESAREFVVVSKAPEFFSYALTLITLLLTVITFVVGTVFVILASMLWRVNKESKELAAGREKVDAALDKKMQEFIAQYEKNVLAFEIQALGLGALHSAKSKIREMILTNSGSVNEMYRELQKTVKYPDLECLHFYAAALDRHKGNVDIERIVRNGLVSFAQNPRTHYGGVEDK